MTTEGVDYAWGRPGASALENAGKTFACRYLSHDTTGKNLTLVEAQALSNAGMWITVVWENGAQDALNGHSQGVSDAQAASAQAASCGMPNDRPIYFAVDFDASSGQTTTINSYLDGAASVLGRNRVGLYAGYTVIKSAFDGSHIGYGWQTYAWSSNQWDPRAQLHQYSNDHIIGGVDLDYDTAMTGDYGQWQVGKSPVTPTQEDDDMPYGQLAEGTKAITPVALPKGRYKTVGFTADNGLQGLPPAALRVAIHTTDKGWQVETATVDSTKGQAVVVFSDAANTDGLSIQREDAGNVHVAWEVS